MINNKYSVTNFGPPTYALTKVGPTLNFLGLDSYTSYGPASVNSGGFGVINPSTAILTGPQAGSPDGYVVVAPTGKKAMWISDYPGPVTGDLEFSPFDFSTFLPKAGVLAASNTSYSEAAFQGYSDSLWVTDTVYLTQDSNNMMWTIDTSAEPYTLTDVSASFAGTIYATDSWGVSASVISNDTLSWAAIGGNSVVLEEFDTATLTRNWTLDLSSVTSNAVSPPVCFYSTDDTKLWVIYTDTTSNNSILQGYDITGASPVAVGSPLDIGFASVGGLNSYNLLHYDGVNELLYVVNSSVPNAVTIDLTNPTSTVSLSFSLDWSGSAYNGQIFATTDTAGDTYIIYPGNDGTNDVISMKVISAAGVDNEYVLIRDDAGIGVAFYDAIFWDSTTLYILFMGLKTDIFKTTVNVGGTDSPYLTSTATTTI